MGDYALELEVAAEAAAAAAAAGADVATPGGDATVGAANGSKPQARIFLSHGAPFLLLFLPREFIPSVRVMYVSLLGEGSLEQLPERSPHLMHTESRVFLRDRHKSYNRFVSVCILVMRERPEIGMCQRCDGGCCML